MSLTNNVRRRLFAACILATSAGMAASIAEADTAPVDWFQPGMNAAHTGYNSSETVITAANVATLTQKWNFQTGAEIFASPILNGTHLYVLSSDGNLYSINTATGQQEWAYQVDKNGAPANWGMLANAGNVYTNCQLDYDTSIYGGHGGLCSLNARNGKLKWSYAITSEGPDFPVDSSPYSPPVLLGRTLYFGESDSGSFAHVGYMVALDRVSGMNVGTIGNCGDSGANDCNFVSPLPPAAITGGIYYDSGSANGGFGTTAFCRQASTLAAPLWCIYPHDNDLAPTIAGGKVFYVENEMSGGSSIVALDANTGATIWSHPETQTSQYHVAPAVANGIVYMLDGNGDGSTLYAVSQSKGKVVWSYPWTGGAGGVTSSPIVANGVVYAQCGGSGSNGSQCAFNAQTGAILRAAGPSHPSRSAPVVANGTLYTVCGPNNMCAYTLP